MNLKLEIQILILLKITKIQIERHQIIILIQIIKGQLKSINI